MEAAINIDFLSSIPEETLQSSGPYGRVYDLQRQLDQAQYRLTWLRDSLYEQREDANRASQARGGFGLLGSDWEAVENHPDMRAAKAEVERLSALVSEAQAEVGGIIFLPATDNLAKIQGRLATLNRKAAKIGSDEITLTPTDEKLVLHYKVNDEDTRGYDFEHVFVVLAGSTPQIPGYEFLATVTPTEHGNLVKRIPAVRFGIRHNLAYGNTDSEDTPAKRALDTIDLARYHHTGDTCEHCRQDRRRSDLYVVYNEQTGESLQVGRTCLRLYMGSDKPERILSFLEQYQELLRGIGSSRGETKLYSTEDFMTHSAAVLRSRGHYERGMGHDAISNLVNFQAKKLDRSGRPTWTEPTPADEQRAAEVINWARSEWTETGSYAESVKIALAGEWIHPGAYGLAASALVAIERWRTQEVKRQEREAEEGESTPVIEGRIQITGKVVSIRWQESQYGAAKKMLVRDDRGFKVWGTAPGSILGVERDERVSFTATVTKSNDDETFGFFSRPVKAEVIE